MGNTKPDRKGLRKNSFGLMPSSEAFHGVVLA